jgi:endonuclease-8
MPEGPQMVFLKEQLEHLIGERVVEATGNAANIPFEKINGQKLVAIKTFGKEILFCFSKFTVRVHLMLFGKVGIDEQLNRLLRLGFRFKNNQLNFYACECRFIEQPLDEVYNWSSDVMNPAFNATNALQKLKSKPNQIACEALLDQNILAGVGNKIKNEALYRQQVHPESVVGEIPDAVLKKLVKDCVKLSFEYLEAKRENTDADLWQVYKKSECKRDRIPIQKQKIGKSKRSCYYCDKCQKLYIEDAL